MVILLYLAGFLFTTLFLYSAFVTGAHFLSGTQVDDLKYFAISMLLLFLTVASFQAADTLRRNKGIKGRVTASELTHMTLDAATQPASKTENWLVIILGIILFGVMVLQREYGILDRFIN